MDRQQSSSLLFIIIIEKLHQTYHFLWLILLHGANGPHKNKCVLRFRLGQRNIDIRLRHTRINIRDEERQSRIFVFVSNFHVRTYFDERRMMHGRMACASSLQNATEPNEPAKIVNK